ncbi:MAG: acyl carrier protein [Ginsengibacter sp.]
MDLSEFVKHFSEQFDETDPSEITGDTEFKELGEWSSLVALTVIAMVDEEYGKKLSGEDIKNSKKVSDLFDLINAKM